jgi:hypothetical protein
MKPLPIIEGTGKAFGSHDPLLLRLLMTGVLSFGVNNLFGQPPIWRVTDKILFFSVGVAGAKLNRVVWQVVDGQIEGSG